MVLLSCPILIPEKYSYPLGNQGSNHSSISWLSRANGQPHLFIPEVVIILDLFYIECSRIFENCSHRTYQRGEDGAPDPRAEPAFGTHIGRDQLEAHALWKTMIIVLVKIAAHLPRTGLLITIHVTKFGHKVSLFFY